MRRSIDSRMDRIVDKLLPVGSMARREYYLPDRSKAALAIHRQETARLISAAGKDCDAYRKIICGELIIPELPYALRKALNVQDTPRFDDTATDDDVAATWNRFRDGER